MRLTIENRAHVGVWAYDADGAREMKRQRTTPSFVGLRPASNCAWVATRGASAKTNTRCEFVLRRELWRRGLRYLLHHPGLPGRPDIVFPKQHVIIFCDGDFWHGRDLEARLAKLARGHNASYWVAKVRRNVERDYRQTQLLKESGWIVLRFWETEVLRRTSGIVDQIVSILTDAAIKKDGPHATHHSEASSSASPSGAGGV